MLIWYFSNNLDIYNNVGKLSEQHFIVWLFSNTGDKILFLLKFNEARISEWNVSNLLPLFLVGATYIKAKEYKWKPEI
jgi:hypothetical protein